ncbi:hypothetical protein FKP32DRAFT_262330 [Trametes sanguinea]|nr:hypothetical protein FKP32DRAFT_262330 [Trametes sanguinea]
MRAALRSQDARMLASPETLEQVRGPLPMDHLLQTVLSRCRELSYLEISSHPLNGPIQDRHTWTCITKLQHLRELLLDSTCLIRESAVLQDLKSLSALSRVHLAIRLRTYVPQDLRGFLSIHRLELDLARDVDADLLPVFVSPELHTLVITFWDPAVLDLMKVVNWASATLKQLRALHIGSFMRHVITGVVVQCGRFDAVISPILNCGALEMLWLHFPLGLVVAGAGDAEVDLLARSLPRLSLLSLSVTFCAGITHTSLISLARRCPKLRYLNLRWVSFADVTAASYRTLDSTLPRHRVLVGLDICGPQDVKDPKACALFLQRLFPNLAAPASKRPCPSCASLGRNCDGRMDKIYEAFEGASARTQSVPARVLRDRP